MGKRPFNSGSLDLRVEGGVTAVLPAPKPIIATGPSVHSEQIVDWHGETAVWRVTAVLAAPKPVIATASSVHGEQMAAGHGETAV